MNHNAKAGRQYGHSVDNALKGLNLKDVKKDPARVIASIIRQQTSQYKKEIRNWKMARDEARNTFQPRRVLLTELYDDLETDAFIKGIVHNNRILKVSNKKFKVVDFKTGAENKDKTDLLQRSWFNNFLKMAMASKFHGHSLLYLSEFNATKGEFTKINTVYREHVVPELCAWTNNLYGSEYNYYDKPPYNNYMMGIGQDDDLGLYDACAPLWILKKHSWANWDEFEEIFGIPIRIAKTASSDKKVLAEIQNWLKAMGSAAYGIFPQDTEMDIKENGQTDAFEVFDRKRKAANEEMEILLLGVKNVSQESGTYGKQETIRKEQNEVVEDDKLFLNYLVNDTLMPLLARNGYPFTENDIFTWDDLEKAKPKERLEIFTGVRNMGYELDQEEVSTELGVNITGVREIQNPFDLSGFNPGKKKKEETEKNDQEKDKEEPEREPENKFEEYTKLHNTLNKLYFNIDVQ